MERRSGKLVAKKDAKHSDLRSRPMWLDDWRLGGAMRIEAERDRCRW
jgi:hypothetical protein